MCKVCQKRVYEMEKIVADKNIYHKMCFKCSHCKRILSLGNFAAMNGKLYCKPHFLELFKSGGGNYEEGFGMEKHSKQWQTTEQTTIENSDGSSHVVKATTQGQNEENAENLPSIGNARHRFESNDENSAPAPRIQSSSQSQSYSERPPAQDVEVLREEQGEKDVVHFQQLNSVRSMFESRGQGSAPPPGPSKRMSKWDKPKAPPPAPVNRAREDGDEEEGEVEASTGNLVHKFQGMGQDEEDDATRKPVRKMTPPREEIERDVTEYQRRYSDEKVIERDPDVIISGDRSREVDELPPRAVTSSLLAKFKSFEDTSAPPPLPTSPKKPVGGVSRGGRQIVTTHSTTTSSSSTAEKTSQLTPDSGISLSDTPHEGYATETVTTVTHTSQQQQHQVDEDGDVVRESDRNDTEELPEQGFTKSLLSRWKQIEQTGPAEPAPTRAPAPKRSWAYKEQKASSAPVVRSNGTTHATEESSMRDEADNREVVRESDNFEEEFLPPPSTTKNMLAKFRNLEQDTSTTSSQAAAPRKLEDTSQGVCN